MAHGGVGGGIHTLHPPPYGTEFKTGLLLVVENRFHRGLLDIDLNRSL